MSGRIVTFDLVFLFEMNASLAGYYTILVSHKNVSSCVLIVLDGPMKCVDDCNWLAKKSNDQKESKFQMIQRLESNNKDS